jgi:uncharacterized protein
VVADPARRQLNPDIAVVTALIGRPPRGRFDVVVRSATGEPVVLRNDPILDDGTPMPTLYWLVGPAEVAAVARIESSGGVNRAEAELGLDVIADAHRRYAAERDALIPTTHTGHRPSGGVAGTRTGLKCLHAHYAWHLAGGDDPAGQWVADELARTAP